GDAERVALSDEALALVAREAEGSLRDAQSLLEQVLTVAGNAADDAAVRQVLGAADRRLVVAVADAVLAGDPGACVRHLAELHAHGYDAQRFCRDLLERSRHLAGLAATGERALVAELPEAEVDALAAQAGRRSADDLQRFFRLLLEADEALAAPARSVDPKLVLEMCAVRLATLPPLLPLHNTLRPRQPFGPETPPPSAGRCPAAAPPPPGPAPAGRGTGAPRAQARRRTEETLADPMVQAAVEIFGAEVRGVRDRRR